MHYLPGSTAADSVLTAEVIRRSTVTGVCRASVPARSRRIVQRRRALTLAVAA